MGLFLTLVLAALVAGPIGPAPRGQPSVQPTWRGQAGYSPAHDPRGTKLYTSRPTGEKVLQGFAGNCFLLAVLSGLERARPEEREAATHTRADGRHIVRLYRTERATGRIRPVDFLVDRHLPRFKRGALLNARSRDPLELSVSMVE